MSDNKSFKVQNGLDVTGDANVSGSVTATSFIGDGSQLTGISGGSGGGTTYSIDETGRGSTDNWIEFDAGVYNNDQVFFKTKGTANTWRGTLGEGGFQFDGLTPNQAFVMQDASNGVKFMGYQYETGGDEGLIIEGKSGFASKSTIYLETNAKTAIKMTDGSVELPSIPTTDPNNTNEIWSDNGVLVMSGSTAPTGGSSSTVSGTVDGHLIPDTNAVYDLGSAEKKFRHLYLSNNSLYAESGRLSFEGGQLTFRDDPVLMLSEVQAIAAASDTFEDFKAALASL